MSGAKRIKDLTFVAALLAASVALLAFGVASAAAAPAWDISSSSTTNSPPSDGDPSSVEHVYHVAIVNDGETDADSAAEPIELSVELPAGIAAVKADKPPLGGAFAWQCPGLSLGDHSFSCTYSGEQTILAPSRLAFLSVYASLEPEASGILTSSFTVSGGGAATVSTVDPVRISATPPPFGLDAFDVAISADPSGQPFTQAGGHPYAVTSYLDFNTVTNPAPLKGDGWPVEPSRDVIVSGPVGLVGNPSAFAECTSAQLANSAGVEAQPECPAASQIGTVKLAINGFGTFPAAGPLPLFNMVPPTGLAARFGFQFAGTVVVVDARLRSESDYGLDFLSRRISEGLDVAGAHVSFWGAPTDARHNLGLERACPGRVAPWSGGPICPADFEQPAFIRMPTSCTPPGQGLPWSISTDSWVDPGAELEPGIPDLSDPAWDSRTIASHKAPGYPYAPEDWGEPQGATGCDAVPIKGQLSAQPTALDTVTSSGLNVHVEVPNPGLDPHEGIASSDIKAVKVTLPEGVTINPSQADGLGVCSPARYESSELSFHPDGTKGCPSDSKIGTVQVKTPLLEETIPGDVYVAEPHNNPFDSLLALYLVFQEPERGIQITLAGEVETDQTTGQITTTFNDLPQLPFSSFDFHFREGARAPLATPPACGTYETVAEFTPWSDPSQTLISKSSFQITRGVGGGPCPTGGLPPFKPGLIAGSLNNNAGSYSPFNLRLHRSDGEQEITRFSIKLPPGLLGKLAGVPFCPEAAIAAAKDPNRSGAAELASPSCPAASEVGRTLVGAGVGSVLTYAPGKIYLAGPYNGSALSIAAITAAKVGPFDLGTVVVRQALRINPETAEVFIDPTGSDPIPHIIDGITVHLRDIRAYVDRPEFTLNPTSCDPTSVASTVLGSGLDFFSDADDNPFTVTTRYQAANCANLGFKPRLALRLLGGTRRGDNPKLRATLTARRGDANIGAAQVTLPHSEFLDQSHIGTICTRVQFKAGAVPGEKCPAASIYGHAKAITPLLDEPLQGPVFLRSSNNPLPDLVAALHSGRIDINLAGRIDSAKGDRIRTTFEEVPDAPVTKFTLTMQGGRKGLLENSANLCKRPYRAAAAFTGQNGKVHDFRPLLRVRCGKHAKQHKNKG